MRQHVLWLACIFVAGCEGYVPTVPETNVGCQVRAGAAGPEGSGGGFTNYVATGAAATVVGDCPDNFRVYARTDGGVVCNGELEWCKEQAATEPLEMTPAQAARLFEEISRGIAP